MGLKTDLYAIGSAPITVTATREVILSAGTIGTVQILQLSGIGDPSLLKPLGITTLINNPNVGENLSDHPFLPNIYSVNGQESFDDTLRDPNLIGSAINQWAATKTGLIANTVVNNMGFSRIPANSTILKTVADPASGPNAPHFEYLPTVSYPMNFERAHLDIKRINRISSLVPVLLPQPPVISSPS